MARDSERIAGSGKLVQSRNLRIVAKWVGFVTAIWVQAISGNNYTFSNYSADLKRVMNYSQTELNGLGIAKDAGKSVGLLAGYLADFLPSQVILMIGAVVGACGYGTTWLVVSERISPPSFWQMCIAVFMGGNSSTWMNTAVLVTCLRNFPRSRGQVSGILKAFVGLSTAVFTMLCAALFTGDSSAFLLLLVALPGGICILAAIFLRAVPVIGGPREDKEEQASFSTLNVIAMFLAIYLLFYTFFGDLLGPKAADLCAVGLLVILATPLVVPGRLLLVEWLNGRSSNEPKNSATEQTGDVKEPLLTTGDSERDPEAEERRSSEVSAPSSGSTVDSSDQRDAAGTISPKCGKPKLGDNFSVPEILSSGDFWLLFLTFLTAIGSGMAFSNNLGQMGEALQHPDVFTFVSFFSIFGFFGRLLSGAVSEHFVRSAALPRPVWMAASKLAMILGYIALAWGAPGALHVGSIIIGFGYGVHLTITVATSSEMFGLKSFGMTYNILVLNIPLGSFLFSSLAGYLYDREVVREEGLGHPGFSSHLASKFFNFTSLSDEADPCYGARCFRTTYLVMALVLAVGFVLDFVLILRLRPLFQKMYGSRAATSRSTDRADTTRQRLT